MERREVQYRGRVQGVGFRYTTLRIARRYQVTGYVKNLATGGVELVVEGAGGQLDGLLEDVAQTMADHVRDADVRKLAATGEFPDFSVRY